ncbi:MAG: hypothetical protein ACRDZR_06205 [Acidimicrobiales bacterium]
MSVDEPPRSRGARAAAERALIRVVHHYGARPAFVVLGGLVPALLCSGSGIEHAGTTDVDVQVDLEIAAGAVHGARLERALRNAEFEPDTARMWRWTADGPTPRVVVKFELLADLADQPAEAIVTFDGADRLGAVNLRGTGFAARDVEVRTLRVRQQGEVQTAEVNVTGLAGYLLAKTAAARSRRLPKDWYDVAYVLIHNDEGGPEAAAATVRARFGDELVGEVRTTLDDLLANFADPDAQGPSAYRSQVTLDHPDLDGATAAADAVVAVESFHRALFGG